MQERFIEGQAHLTQAIKEFSVFEKRIMKLEEWVEGEKKKHQVPELHFESDVPEQEGGETGAAEVVEEGEA